MHIPVLEEWYRRVFDTYVVPSYSQEGEDRILQRLFEDRVSGFYIDVGAHHPARFSNTYLFYRQGWRGINIDAMPDSMKLFQRWRPRDINLEVAISDRREKRTYYMFNDPALNNFSEHLSHGTYEKVGYQIVGKREIQTMPLSDVLSQYLPADIEIQFLSVDVEGLDLSVLKSNDWDQFRPEVVLVEELAHPTSSSESVVSFLRELGYAQCARTLNTLFFRL